MCEIWWAWVEFGLWFYWMQIFSWTLTSRPEESFAARRVKGKRRSILFRPLTLKLLTSVLLLFRHCIKAGSFKASVKEENTAFPGARVALIRIGFCFGMFCLAFEPKRSEGDREKSRAVDVSLMAKRSINLQWEKKDYITDLQNVHYLWTLGMNHHQPNIQGRDLTVPTLNSGTSW